MQRYTISPFGHVKRAELIKRWVSHYNHLSESELHEREIHFEQRINELLAQTAIPSAPMTLTLFLDSMDSNTEMNESIGAFGYHYQRLILQALEQGKARCIQSGQQTATDDIALELLGRLAYKQYASDSDLTMQDAEFLARVMKEELAISFKTRDALGHLIASGLLRASGNLLSFPFKYIYQFSLANLLQLWLDGDLHKEEVRRIIDDLISRMHESECASILMFFTFLARDSATIKAIISQANETFPDVPPCDFGDDLDSLCTKPIDRNISDDTNIRQNRSEKNKALDAQGRKALDDENAAMLASVHASSREAIHEIERALQCIVLLGQILRSYPTRLSGEEKTAVANAAYSLGFRTLTRFTDAIKSAESSVREYFRRIASGFVDPQDALEVQAELERQFSRYVQLGSIAIVRRIGRAVGSVHLRPVYDLVEVDGCERAVRLVNKSINLELLNNLEPKNTIGMFEELVKDDNRVAALVLQWLVFDYLLLHPMQHNVRQSLLDKLNLPKHPKMLASGLRQQNSLPPAK